MSERQNEYEFVGILTRELGDRYGNLRVVTLATDLMKLGAKASKLAVNLCNVPDYQETFDKGIERVRKAVAERLDGTGIGFEVGGDPRGFTLKLTLKGATTNGASNHFGGESWGVPRS